MDLPDKKLSKKKILELISKLKKNPSAKYQILADLGIAGAGMAGAGAVAAVAGASVAPIGFGVTALTGFGIAVAAPVVLVAGASVAGGAAAYGITQAVRFKAHQHGKLDQMIKQLEEMLRDMDYQETRSQTTDTDKTRFIIFLEEPIKLNLISEEDASDLIQLVENGQISLFEAYRLVKDILKEFDADKKKSQTDILLPKLLGCSAGEN
ncbi:hypothetical protein Xen7305DRAFT_00033330 [Xenococcus sp. PCC 7305]|uniref:hypothetical protein n=1 Tax=Xenococcus sp. PCC 7305 TaxID=102125 RepID=UPI0002AC7306|nr:hypothetical protein [Xenococcus sp. PCC 7305]ELS03609.1 hypothetical protein Xen7305DRAFT_00033330 [Xenococcus sp. PCC 7305]